MLRRTTTKLSRYAGAGNSVSSLRPAVSGTKVISSGIAKREFSWFSNMMSSGGSSASSGRGRLEELGGDDAKLNHLRRMNISNPRETILAIERGWQSGTIPTTEPFAKEYCKAAFALKRFDDVNLEALTLMLQANSEQGLGGIPIDANGNVPAAQVQQLIAATMMNQKGGGGGMGSGAGESADRPLYIAPRPAGFKDQFWKLLGVGVSSFIILAFLSTLFDPKQMASKMGMSSPNSTIKQAEHSDKTFADVVGVDEAKEELVEIVEYLKEPSKFTRLGGKLPKGVLLTGPPGTGKTLLAKAIAGEAEVPFFYSSGSEFEEMYVGVGARRIRDLFAAANANAPCIIFIDEIDAVGGSRNLKDQTAMKMTLNQLLVEMDGFQENNGVIVIGATNFAEALDNALTRPGRFDRHVDVPLPDVGGRKEILKLYSTKIPMAPEVDLEQIARGTPGFSGAELFNLMNQAAVKSSIKGLESVSMAMLEWAKDKITMGSERQSAILTKETLKLTAHHEAGHALVGILTDGADPIHKATIIPRGRALGLVLQLPDGDQTSYSYKQMLARLDVCMGGRIAEELMFGRDNVTSGASSDIQQATRLARAMVTKYGLSNEIGAVYISNDPQSNRDGSGAVLSESMQEKVDAEIKKLLDESYARVKLLLETNKKKLQNIATGLLEYETISGEEIVELMNYDGAIEDIKTLFQKGSGQGNGGKRSQKPSRELQEIPLDYQKKKRQQLSEGKNVPQVQQQRANSSSQRDQTTSASATASDNTAGGNSVTTLGGLTSWLFGTGDNKSAEGSEDKLEPSSVNAVPATATSAGNSKSSNTVVSRSAPVNSASVAATSNGDAAAAVRGNRGPAAAGFGRVTPTVPSSSGSTVDSVDPSKKSTQTSTVVAKGSNGTTKTTTTTVTTEPRPNGSTSVTTVVTDVVTNADGVPISKATTQTRRLRGPPARELTAPPAHATTPTASTVTPTPTAASPTPSKDKENITAKESNSAAKVEGKGPSTDERK